jgi:hypothetical protein
MQGKTRERWQELCEQAALEQNPTKMLEIVEEINRLLAVKYDRLSHQDCARPKTSKDSIYAWHVVSVQNRGGGWTTSARVLKFQVGLLVGGLGFTAGALALPALRWEHRPRGQMKIGQDVRY